MDYIITGNEISLPGFVILESISKIWKKIEMDDGKVWLIPTNVPNPGDFIHYWNPNEKPTRPTLQGYGGRTLKFVLEDGIIFECSGPWHSNSDSLYENTGIDLRDKHMTFVVISKEEEFDSVEMNTIMLDVLYIDNEPNIGNFNRGEILAKDFANKIGKTVHLYSQSKGGSYCGSICPDKEEL